jgi:hypothetical protein
MNPNAAEVLTLFTVGWRAFVRLCPPTDRMIVCNNSPNAAGVVAKRR